MQPDPLSPTFQDDLSRRDADLLPTLAITLSSEGVITTEDIGCGGFVPHWAVKITITYLDTPNTLKNPITFRTPRVGDDSQYQLRYLLDGQWRDAELGVGCMLGMDFSRRSEIRVAYCGGEFASLHPGEVWETSLSVFQLDWECPDDDGAAYAGDAFRLQYMGAPVEWWQYGGREDHKETVVTLDAFGRVLSPKDNDERAKLVFQRSNVLEARWCKPSGT